MNKFIYWFFRIDWISTLRFNFHYLPLNQAIKLPFFLYKSKLIAMKGKVTLQTDKIKPGMVKLGIQMVNIYYEKVGFVWENQGGEIIIKGRGELGAGSAVSIFNSGNLIIGEHFHCTSNFKIIVTNSINLGCHFRAGWNTLMMDTDFHSFYNITKNEYSVKSAPIIIGDYTWIGNGCLILKGTILPKYSAVGARTILNKNINVPSFSLIAGNPAQIIRSNIIYDLYVKYYNLEMEEKNGLG